MERTKRNRVAADIKRTLRCSFWIFIGRNLFLPMNVKGKGRELSSSSLRLSASMPPVIFYQLELYCGWIRLDWKLI